jgi:hypothetical protein
MARFLRSPNEWVEELGRFLLGVSALISSDSHRNYGQFVVWEPGPGNPLGCFHVPKQSCSLRPLPPFGGTCFFALCFLTNVIGQCAVFSPVLFTMIHVTAGPN